MYINTQQNAGESSEIMEALGEKLFFESFYI